MCGGERAAGDAVELEEVRADSRTSVLEDQQSFFRVGQFGRAPTNARVIALQFGCAAGAVNANTNKCILI